MKRYTYFMVGQGEWTPHFESRLGGDDADALAAAADLLDKWNAPWAVEVWDGDRKLCRLELTDRAEAAAAGDSAGAADPIAEEKSFARGRDRQATSDPRPGRPCGSEDI